MGWKDRQDSRVRDAEPRAEYPWMQWVNKGSYLDPRHESGGFFITAENMAMIGEPEIDGAEACTLVFSNEDSDTGIYLPAVDIAVMGTRFAWRTTEGNRSQLSATYTPGARGKLQALVLLKTQGGYAGPLMLTLTGTVTKDLSTAIKAHRQAIRQATEGNGALPWFWLPLVAGTPEQRGTGSAHSMVTPIISPAVPAFSPEFSYVGDEIADWMESVFETTERWTQEWDTAGQDAEQQPHDDETPAPTETDAPGPSTGSYAPIGEARKDWSERWNQLKAVGLSAPFLNPTWNAEQINTAAARMVEAREKIVAGTAIDAAAAELLAGLEKI